MNWFKRQNRIVQLLIVMALGGFTNVAIHELRDGTFGTTFTPDFIEYRRYSAETLPITFEAPRIWKINTNEPRKLIVGKREAGIDNVVGIVVTVTDKAEFLEGTETLYDKLVHFIYEENARPLDKPFVAGQEGLIGFTTKENESESETAPFRALHLPTQTEFSNQGITWLFVPYVGYRSGIFDYYFVAMRATAEIDNQIVEVQASCFGGDIYECQNLHQRTLRSVKLR